MNLVILVCREKSEIEVFVKDVVVVGEDCLGCCFYISGVFGIGKVSVEWFKVNSFIYFLCIRKWKKGDLWKLIIDVIMCLVIDCDSVGGYEGFKK